MLMGCVHFWGWAQTSHNNLCHVNFMSGSCAAAAGTRRGAGSRKTLFLGPGKDPSVLVPQSCLTLCDPMLLCPWNSPGKNSGVGSHSLLQGIFPTWGLNPSLLHCKQILYHLSHQRNPREPSKAWGRGRQCWMDFSQV